MRGSKSAQRLCGYDGGGIQYIRVEQSFYRNKVLLDNSAEYGREVKDLGVVRGWVKRGVTGE